MGFKGQRTTRGLPKIVTSEMTGHWGASSRIYTCTYALKLRKRRSTSRSTSSPSSFPVPLVSKTAPSVSLLWRFSSTSLPFLLSTSFQSRLTVPFLLLVYEDGAGDGPLHWPNTDSNSG